MSKEKAMVKQEASALAMPENLKGSWGTEGVDSTDIKIPAMRMCQQMSERVAEGKAQAGDVVLSTRQDVLCPKGQAVEFIPLMTFKTWQLSKKVNGKFLFQKTEPMTPENVNSEWSWEEDGEEWKRTRVLNFYCLLPSDIEKEIKALEAVKRGEMPDPDDALLPVLMSFRSTSYDAGKDLATHFKKAEHFSLPPAVTTFKLTTELIKGDQGHYYVYRVEKSRKTTTEELTVAKGWFDTLHKVNVIADDPEETSESPAEAPANVAKF
jgi:hypothetical protein